MKCPKCGSEKIVIRTRGGTPCCGANKYICTKCQFVAPKRIFEEGVLPSEKGK